MNEERIVRRRATRRKAIKKENKGSKRKKKRGGEKEKRVESQDMDDRGDTRLFHKVDQRVLEIVNHHFQSSALVYNIYIYTVGIVTPVHTYTPTVFLEAYVTQFFLSPRFYYYCFVGVIVLWFSRVHRQCSPRMCREERGDKSRSSSITGSEREEPPAGFSSLNQSLIYSVDIYIPPPSSWLTT